MNSSHEPDVNRLLGKLGRGEFGYRTFGNSAVIAPVAALEPARLQADTSAKPPEQQAVDLAQLKPAIHSAASAFSLLGAALPEAAQVPCAAAPLAPAPKPDDDVAAQPLPRPPEAIAVPNRLSQPPTPQTFVANAAYAPVTDRSSSTIPQAIEAPPVRLAVQRSIFGGAGPASNPFPPRNRPEATPRNATTSLTAVFRALTGSRQPEPPPRIGSGFPFRQR